MQNNWCLFIITLQMELSFRLQPESSILRTFWMLLYQVRDRLLKSGMTEYALYGQTLIRNRGGFLSPLTTAN